jgi:hypothetical protein
MRDPQIANDTTAAALRNLIEDGHPTILIDEADMLTMDKSLRVVLNSGVEKGNYIRRASKTAGGVDSYDPFCPKVVAGIHGDKAPLDGPTLDRAITITLRRKHPGAAGGVEEFDSQTAYDDTEDLRDFLTDWRKTHDTFHLARPKLPDELNDRQRDGWRPLIAIADRMEWGREARQWAVELSSREDPPDVNEQVLRDVYEVLRNHPDDMVMTSEIAMLRNRLPDAQYPDDINTRQLGMRLAALGLPAVKFYRGGKQVRGQFFRMGGKLAPAWQDAVDRYGLS